MKEIKINGRIYKFDDEIKHIGLLTKEECYVCGENFKLETVKGYDEFKCCHPYFPGNYIEVFDYKTQNTYYFSKDTELEIKYFKLVDKGYHFIKIPVDKKYYFKFVCIDNIFELPNIVKDFKPDIKEKFIIKFKKEMKEFIKQIWKED